MSSFLPHEARRYGRQMLLPTIAAQGQRNLLSSKVLVIGAGGIGSSAALYLASAGVPITVMDNDLVEESNLHRQIIHDSGRTQTYKAESAVARLNAINPTLSYSAIIERITTDNAYDIIKPFDLVLDCTDNFEARYVINDACVLLGVPYISGSAVGLEGQITVIVPQQTACYRCLYPNPSTTDACRSCANAGVLGPVPGLIGCLEATEAIKVLLKALHKSSGPSPVAAAPAADALQVLTGRQIFYDAAQGEFFTFDLPPRNSSCSVCGDQPTITSLDDTKSFLESLHLQTQCAVDAYRGDIPIENKISVAEFKEILLSQNDQTVFIVDVRSKIQFGIANLASSSHVHITYPSFSSYLDKSIDTTIHRDSREQSKTVILINIPLADLQSDQTIISQLIQPFQSVNTTPVSLLMLCRRGIDSTVATRHILERFPELPIWNVEGGLTAWHSDIDPDFPMY